MSSVKGHRTLIGCIIIFVMSLVGFYAIDLTPEQHTFIAQLFAHGTIIFTVVMRISWHLCKRQIHRAGLLGEWERQRRNQCEHRMYSAGLHGGKQ